MDSEQSMESRIWFETTAWSEFLRIESLHQQIRAQFELARRNYEMQPDAQGENHQQCWQVLCEMVGSLRDASRAINQLTNAPTATPQQPLLLVGDTISLVADSR